MVHATKISKNKLSQCILNVQYNMRLNLTNLLATLLDVVSYQSMNGTSIFQHICHMSNIASRPSAAILTHQRVQTKPTAIESRYTAFEVHPTSAEPRHQPRSLYLSPSGEVETNIPPVKKIFPPICGCMEIVFVYDFFSPKTANNYKLCL